MQPNYLDKYLYDKNDILTFHRSIADVKGNLWVYSNRMAACFCINLNTYMSNFIGWNDKCSKIGYGADVVDIYDDFLINITRDSRYIEIINLINKSKKYVLLEYSGEKEPDKYISLMLQNRLILISTNSKEIFVFDLANINSKEKVKGEKYLRKSTKNSTIHRAFVIKDYLIFLLAEEPDIELIDLRDFSTVTYMADSIGSEITDIVVDGGRAYVLSAEGHIAIFDKESGYQLEYVINDIENDNGKYLKLLATREKIWVFPATKNEILIMNKQDGKMQVFAEYPENFQFQYPDNHGKYASFSENNNYHFVGQRSANYLLIIDKKTEKIRWEQARYPKGFLQNEFIKEIYSDSKIYNKIINEEVIGLDSFFELIGNISNKEDTEKFV